MNEIYLTSNTSLNDVLNWHVREGTRFVLTRTAGFETGVQGVALSALRTLAQSNDTIQIACDFSEPSDHESVADSPFGSPFVFSLARLTSDIRFGPERQSASKNFKTLLGSSYIRSGGEFGTGKEQSLLCVDPRFPIPDRLRPEHSNKTPEFPPPSIFAREIRRMVKSMGFTQILSSSAEEPLITLIYELFKNTFEHGIPATGRSGRSTRAIILEKIVLQGSDISKRQLSSDLKNYLQRINEGDPKRLKLGVLCLTVTDQGNGIQATLPALDGETEIERLIRAFRENESRKPVGAVARGQGLTRALKAAFDLNAMIQVCSNGLNGSQDFSLWEEKYPYLKLTEVRRLPITQISGTSISVFIPEHSHNLDQTSLFA
jgi:hypothetical protein